MLCGPLPKQDRLPCEQRKEQRSTSPGRRYGSSRSRRGKSRGRRRPMLKLLGGLGSLGVAVVAALLLLVAIFSVQLSGSTVGGGPCLPSLTGTAGTGGCSGNGAVVAQAARAMAPHLYGNPDAWYDAG